MTQAEAALARLVIVAPGGRFDLALPDDLPVVNLLPAVLRHSGDDADDGSRHGGWALRRTDGSVLDLARSLAAQQVRDGELLHLTPRRAEWPELSYDDLVDAIATGAGKRGLAWTPAATRLTGLVVTTLILLVGLVVVLRSGTPWWIGGTGALVTAVLLLATGVILSRAAANSLAGAVVAGAGLPFAFVGGVLVLAGRDPLGSVGAPHLLTGCATLLLVGALGRIGVADGGRVFIAAITAGVYGAIGAGLATRWLDAVGSAVVVAGLLTLMVPGLPLLAVRFGKIPLPALPRTTDDLLRDETPPDRAAIYRATERADEWLTGLIMGSSVVASVCLFVLTRMGSASALVLAGIVATALLLRARLLITIRHRTPLLAAGLVGVVLLPLVATAGLSAAAQVGAVLPALLGLAAIICSAGLAYSGRPPSPRIGRLGDMLDITLQLIVVPVACSALGLFGFFRGIAG